MDFKAAVLHKPGEEISIESVQLKGLGTKEVLIQVKASGLFHTDLEIIDGELNWPFPVVLGHEGSGEVVEVGSEVRLVSVGDRVVCSWTPACGVCFFLRTGPTHSLSAADPK